MSTEIPKPSDTKTTGSETSEIGKESSTAPKDQKPKPLSPLVQYGASRVFKRTETDEDLLDRLEERKGWEWVDRR